MAWAPDYASVSDLKSYLRIGDEADDPEIGLALTAASRAIDHVTHRQFGLVDTPETRTYGVDWSMRHGVYVARIDDVMTLTGLIVEVSGSAVAAARYELTPINAAAAGVPWERVRLESATAPTVGSGRLRVNVTARWGWSTIPVAVKQAALLQAARIFKRQDAPFGVAGSLDQGSEIRLLDKVDADVATVLRTYRRDVPLI